MKVYCTPIKIRSSVASYPVTDFFHDFANVYKDQMDYETVDRKVMFSTFERDNHFIFVAITMKKTKSFCQAEFDTLDQLLLSYKELDGNGILECNILLFRKDNLSGVYVYNEGSMRLARLDVKLRNFFYEKVRAKAKRVPRKERFDIQRLVDNSTLMDKLSKFDFVDELNVTLTGTTVRDRILNGSSYEKAKTVRLSFRTDGVSMKIRKNKKELHDYIEELKKEHGSSISVKGRYSGAMDGETIDVIDTINSIYTIEHDEYLKDLDNVKMSDFGNIGLCDVLIDKVDKNKLITSQQK
ncbi:hypothetical protein [Proteus sp. CD3]|uniref:hypothetical protein n=1 Tax=Proteus sp. CD3 TaxID=1921565 RepID=UPI00124A1EB6|nr:hypothetical protein [Proteus sp. CD3]QEZ91864.1 hypothetical protein BTA34_05675 [Proteus sp. CD3]